MKLTIFFASALLLLSEKFAQCSDAGKPCPPQENPCKDIKCEPGRCWYDCDKHVSCYNPCLGNGNCPEGTKCEIVPGECGDYSCPPGRICKPNNPPPPNNPCAAVLCNNQTRCYVDGGKGICENACISALCLNGTDCKTVQGDCGSVYCRPKANCVPRKDPCDNVTCPYNHRCYYEQDRKPKCYNQCDYSYTKCKAGYTCRTEVGPCGNYSCKPTFRCVSPCENNTCDEYDVCYVDGGKAQCALNPCAYTDCLRCYQCLPGPGDCGDDTCQPKARCYNECDGKKCPGTSKCYIGSDGKAKCYDPCYRNPCKRFYSCASEMGDCGSTCCEPKRVCISPCARVRCKAGYKCYVSDDKGAQCVNLCSNYTCDHGYKCQTEYGPCNDDSCAPVRRCVSPCDDFECEDNNLCYFEPCEKPYPEPKCSNPCEYVKCDKGYECRTVPGCCGGDYCAPKPKCVNKCELTYCPESSYCYLDKATGEPNCVNACASKPCPPGYSCVAKPGPCSNYSCKPTHECVRQYPPRSCDDVKCYGNKTCRTVYTYNYGNVPVCGENKCINFECCSVRDGGYCNDDACYLKLVSCKDGEGCETQPECKDPCRVGNVKCEKPEYCYKQQVQCFVAPCPLLATCRIPCGPGNLCGPDQTCYVDRTYERYDGKPAERCKNNVQN